MGSEGAEPEHLVADLHTVDSVADLVDHTGKVVAQQLWERIPEHIRTVVGWEALAWHSPGRWQQQWELTDLVTDVRARAAGTGWSDWLRWARASTGDDGDADPIIQMLTADQGDLVTFALVSADKK